jgi:hypothetical protein
MASFFKQFGDTSPALLAAFFLFVGLMLRPVYAGGNMMDEEDRVRMCSATSNLVLAPADDDCPSPIVSESGQKHCPHPKPSLACEKLLEDTERVCEITGNDDYCDIVTPGQAVETAIEQQLEGAP